MAEISPSSNLSVNHHESAHVRIVGGPSESDWARQQTLIEQLYEHHTLSEVMESMKNQQQFKAT